MKSSIRWRSLPRALWWHIWNSAWAVPFGIVACALVVVAIAAVSLAIVRVAGVAVNPGCVVQATSITPITSTSDGASGLTFSGDAYEVTCTVSSDTVTLYAAMHDGAAWRIYDATACTLAVGAGRTCRFPAERQTGQTWNAYKTGSGSVASCTARKVEGPLARRGGSSTPCPECAARVAPDASDVLVWYNGAGVGASGAYDRQVFSLPWASTGSNTLDLTTLIGGDLWRYPGIGAWGDAWIAPDVLSSNMAGGSLITDPTSVGESQTFTASAWVYVQTLPTSTVLCGLFGKRDDTGAWDLPYAAWGLYIGDDASLIVGMRLDDGSNTQVIIQSDSGVFGAGLHHVGMTWASQTLTLYLDGQVAEGTTPSAESFDMAFYSHGPYFLGGFPNSSVGSGAFYAGGWVSDVRIASVARDVTWFASVWASRRSVS